MAYSEHVAIPEARGLLQDGGVYFTGRVYFTKTNALFNKLPILKKCMGFYFHFLLDAII